MNLEKIYTMAGGLTALFILEGSVAMGWLSMREPYSWPALLVRVVLFLSAIFAGRIFFWHHKEVIEQIAVHRDFSNIRSLFINQSRTGKK